MKRGWKDPEFMLQIRSPFLETLPSYQIQPKSCHFLHLTLQGTKLELPLIGAFLFLPVEVLFYIIGFLQACEQNPH